MNKVNTIEVGHIFKLGLKYSQVMEANFSDISGKLKPVVMGCYGIGVSRLISAVIEQNNDADGIIWPQEIAPFQIIILPLDVTNKAIMQEALDLYKQATEAGFSVLLDDRDERAGVKFKDADLIGIPYRITVGKRLLSEDKVEIKTLKSPQPMIVSSDQAIDQVMTLLKEKKRIV